MVMKISGQRALQGKQWIGQIIIAFVLLVLMLVILFPFAFMLSLSFSTEAGYIKYGLTLFPRQITLSAYKAVITDSQVLRSLGNTIFITVVGSLMSIVFTVLMAYPLSKRDLPGGRIITCVCFLSMLFNGGIIPQLMIVIDTGLSNTLFSLIIPFLISPWYLILMRNFFEMVPGGILEAAEIDGAGQLTILSKFILPLSIPGVIAVLLFYALQKWNEWFYAVLFISDENRWPLQVYIRNMFMTRMQGGMSEAGMLGDTYKNALLMFSIIPLLLLFGFAQKYFVRGLTQGAIKS